MAAGVGSMGLFRKFFERRRSRRQAEVATAMALAAAVRHFELTSGQAAHRGMGAVIGKDPRGMVVRICHGGTRPPRRTWYIVGTDGSVVTELSHAEAAQFGESPWR